MEKREFTTVAVHRNDLDRLHDLQREGEPMYETVGRLVDEHEEEQMSEA